MRVAQSRPARRAAAGAIVAALTAVALLPAPGRASVVHTYGRFSIDDWFEVKGFQVSVEGVHTSNGPDHVGTPAPPGEKAPTLAKGDAEVCITADSGLVTKGRVRTAVREQACTVRAPVFRYDASTAEASFKGKVRTALWERKWTVEGNRWQEVYDRTTQSKAKLNITWRWSQTPFTAFLQCRQGIVTFAAGLGGPANVRGSLTFIGAGVTAKIPDGTTGEKFMGVCPNPS